MPKNRLPVITSKHQSPLGTRLAMDHSRVGGGSGHNRIHPAGSQYQSVRNYFLRDFSDLA
jgi:hypothetical protein